MCTCPVPFQLHAAVTEMEQEKFELQKKHTENIQELLEDTNLRLAKMEAEYNARSQATVSAEMSVCLEFPLRVWQHIMLFKTSKAPFPQMVSNLNFTQTSWQM